MHANSFAFGIEGSAQILRAVADAIDETIGDYYRGLGWNENHEFPSEIASLQQGERVRNVGSLEIAGVLSVFVLSCFGKKIFDEVYDRTAKRPIAEFFDKFLSSVVAPKRKKIEFRDVIYFEDIDTVIVIRAMIDGEDTKRVSELILQGHRVAHMYLEAHGRIAPVHCHTIQDGKIDLEPKVFVSLAQLNHENRNP